MAEEQQDNLEKKPDIAQAGGEQVPENQMPQAEQGNSAQAESQGAEQQPVAAVDSVTEPVTSEPSGPRFGKKKLGIVAGVVVVVAIGAIGFGYVSGQRARQARKDRPIERAAVPTPEIDELTAKYEQQSDSDEIAAIERDLANTSFEGIDAEFSDIDKELAGE